MQVNDVGLIRDGGETLIEVRFQHIERPGVSFLVRFSLSDGELLSPAGEWDNEAMSSAATVIWANMVEIAALPDDYLPRGVRDGEVEVVA